MSWKTLEVERDGPLAYVWLNRPRSRNALNQVILEEIAQVFGWLETQFDVRAVVLGGRGPTFCAGADRKEAPGVARMMAAGVGPREQHWLARLGPRALDAIERLEVPTIARIQGHAIGGGGVLALACDFRIAAEGTLFYFPEVELSSPLDWRGVPRLIREVGLARARELVLLCERIDAAQAERYGLVNRVVPAERLDETVRDWALRLAEKPEAAVRNCKAQFRSYSATSVLGDASEFETNLLLEALRDEATRASFGL